MISPISGLTPGILGTVIPNRQPLLSLEALTVHGIKLHLLRGQVIPSNLAINVTHLAYQTVETTVYDEIRS